MRRIWEALFPPSPGSPVHRHWSDHLIRRTRYEILWTFFNQSCYRGIYSDAVRREFEAYRNVRPIYNACGRIIEFHAAHLMGGVLDPAAGDGKTIPSCLPILVDEHADEDVIRPAIAAIWKASNWQVRKSLFTRYGSCLGDVGIEVIADEERKLIRMRVVHAGEIERVTRDAYGNVKSYILSRWELDPDDPQGQRLSLYREIVTNDGGTVKYETTKDGNAYAWPGTEGAAWESRWGFVPVVLVQHIDQGGDWGMSEIQNALFKTVERDSQGSNLSDQAMKAVNGPWFLTGASLAPAPPRVPPYNGDPFAPQCPPGASPNLTINLEDNGTNVPILTCNASEAKMTPLVFPLPIADVDAHIRTISDALEMDYPELQLDNTQVGGDASAKALREIKKKVNRKITERRAGYDHALVRAHQMGMTMGGMLGFPGFEAFTEGSFAAGSLDHQIGTRAVFESDPLDIVEEEQARAMVVKTYTDAGVPMDEALLRAGWSQDDVDEAMAAKETADNAAMNVMRDRQAMAFADQPVTANDGTPTNGKGTLVGAGAGKIKSNGKANGFGGHQ